jgi:hypothetical protein
MRCPEPYVSNVQGASKGLNAPTPFGTGYSAPLDGNCPISKPWDNEEEIEPLLAQYKISAFEEAGGWFFQNFKVEMQTHWSWTASRAAGWVPKNLSHLPSRYLNICKVHSSTGPSNNGHSDLPWYNDVPTAHSGTSPVVMMMGVGLVTLLGAAILLKLILNVLERSKVGIRPRALQPAGSLELPPRLLGIARRTQGRKPSGVGALGLTRRTSSREVTALEFPLMSQQNAIAEGSDEEDFGSPQLGSHLTRAQLAAAAAAALLAPQASYRASNYHGRAPADALAPGATLAPVRRI